MEELPNDMFQEIYKYLTQYEILNMLMLNKRIFEQTMKYIDSIYIFNKQSNYKLFGNIKTIQNIVNNWKYQSYPYGIFIKNNIINVLNDKLLYRYFIEIFLDILTLNNYVIYIIDYFTKFDTIINYNFMCSFILRKERNSNIMLCIESGIKTTMKCGSINIIKFFINRYNIKFDYALRIACYYNHIDIVKLLLDNGCRYLSGALFMACLKKNIYIIDLLLKYGVNISNNLLYYIFSHSNKIFRHLVKYINENEPKRFIDISRYKILLKKYSIKKYK